MRLRQDQVNFIVNALMAKENAGDIQLGFQKKFNQAVKRTTIQSIKYRNGLCKKREKVIHAGKQYSQYSNKCLLMEVLQDLFDKGDYINARKVSTVLRRI